MTTAAPETHRVLVVDDEPNIVDVISMALRFQGFDVASAATGADALAQVGEFRPQLIVLDVMLPDMEGFEVGPAARSRCCTAWTRTRRAPSRSSRWPRQAPVRR